MRMSTPTSEISRACELVGGRTAMSRVLQVTPSAVSQWCNGIREVPAERCPLIEQATGGVVRCEDLRPDVAWGVLRTVEVKAA